VREAIAFLLLACACGAATWSGRSSDARRRAIDEEGPPTRAGDPLPGALPADGIREPDGAFATLEARAASLAPGMRQAAERESTGERTELVRAAEKDTCVRVAFEATAPVLARLLDADGSVLCETHSPAAAGVLGERGPVCVRKNDSVSSDAEAGGGRIRWIAWASP
jgi:hypothetical protein